ncbi:MAG: hypothetical protein AAFV53_39770 [Myxococcota bacterium]
MLPYHYYFITFMAMLTMFLLQGRRQFDTLVRWLHEHHPSQWEASGKPIGFFWQPEAGATWAEGSRARSQCFRSWMRTDPDWMTDQPTLQRTLRWARINLVISYTGFGIAGIGLILVQFVFTT